MKASVEKYNLLIRKSGKKQTSEQTDMLNKIKNQKYLRKMVCWLVGFYGISTFEGYLTPSTYLCK